MKKAQVQASSQHTVTVRKAGVARQSEEVKDVSVNATAQCQQVPHNNYERQVTLLPPGIAILGVLPVLAHLHSSTRKLHEYHFYDLRDHVHVYV